MRVVGKKYWNRTKPFESFCYNIPSVNQSCSASKPFHLEFSIVMDNASLDKKLTSMNLFSIIHTDKSLFNFLNIKIVGQKGDIFLDNYYFGQRETALNYIASFGVEHAN